MNPHETESGLESCPIRSEADLIGVRALLRQKAAAAGFGVVDQTKFITAGSELARNILKYAGGRGAVSVESLDRGPSKKGLRAVFIDDGPGIADVELAMRDGYSSGNSMGIGLPGARRLVDEFSIDSQPGHGTRVVIVKWAR